MTTAARHDATTVALHALSAAGVIAAIGVGAWMTQLPSGLLRLKAYNWHKWIGATVLLLTLLRLAWRAARRPLPPPALPRWQLRAASAVQAALLALLVAVPLLGWAYSSAAGFPLVWLGVLPLPDWVPVDRALADVLKPWHRGAAWTLAGLAALHVAAAAKHAWIDRDGVAARMAPWGR